MGQAGVEQRGGGCKEEETALGDLLLAQGHFSYREERRVHIGLGLALSSTLSLETGTGALPGYMRWGHHPCSQANQVKSKKSIKTVISGPV